MAKLRAAECREFIKAVIEKAEEIGAPVAVASSLSLPSLACGITADAGEKIIATRPASRSVAASGLPL